MTYRTIPLSRGQVALVDAEDYEWLSQWKWYAAVSMRSCQYYAATHDVPDGGPRRMVRMHRLVIGLDCSDSRQVDHIDGNGLNNRRGNLRIATESENNFNRDIQRNNTSGFRGVSFHRGTGKWMSQTTVKGKYHNLGLYETPEQAHEAYLAACLQLRGELPRISRASQKEAQHGNP